MTLDALRERVRIPLPWAVTVFAVITVGVFAGAWLSGSPLWLVALSTLIAATFTGLGLTVSGPMLADRTVRTVAHLLLGLLGLAVALLGTLLGVAEGITGVQPVDVVVLGSFWALGLTLVIAGVFVFFEAHRYLRPVARVGLALAVVWGVVVAAVLGDIAVGLLLEGFDSASVGALQDDLVPFLALFAAFVVFPALVFRQDLRELDARDADGR